MKKKTYTAYVSKQAEIKGILDFVGDIFVVGNWITCRRKKNAKFDKEHMPAKKLKITVEIQD